jgi:hypothetical protein
MERWYTVTVVDKLDLETYSYSQKVGLGSQSGLVNALGFRLDESPAL